MRIVGLLALTFLALLLFGRIFGRDALLIISLACNIMLIGMRLYTWFDTKIAASRREQGR